MSCSEEAFATCISFILLLFLKCLAFCRDAASEDSQQEPEQALLPPDNSHEGNEASQGHETRVRLYTQSCRLELFCAQDTWENLTRLELLPFIFLSALK